MGYPLPLQDPFAGFPDGGSWPTGGTTGGWAIPGPDYNSSCASDISGGQGRIILGNGPSSMFNARLVTDDAPVYDLNFKFDLSQIVPFLGLSSTSTDPNIFLWVKLEDTADGVDFYEIYLDPYGLQATIRKNTSGPAGYTGLPYSEPTGNGSVALPDLDTTIPLSVRILESGTSRSFKVWQGVEPQDFTVIDDTAPLHVGPRYIDLYVSAKYEGGAPNLFVGDVTVNTGGDAWTYISVGETDHFRFWYDSSLGDKGSADAQAEMPYIEDDLQYHFRWFGNTATWESGPAKIDVKYVNDSHSIEPKATTNALAFYDRNTTTIYVNWLEPNPDIELSTMPRERSILVHELVHYFQFLQTLGSIKRYQSFAEAHAAFLERQFRYDVDPEQLRYGGYADNVKTWLDSARPDYVSDSYTGDGPEFDLAVGCQLLFLNYMKYQLGYSAAAITQANSPVKWGTPNALYAALTGDFLFDPAVKFYQELDRFLPRGVPVDTSTWFDIANPYPLNVSNVIHSTSGPGGFVSQANLAKITFRK